MLYLELSVKNFSISNFLEKRKVIIKNNFQAYLHGK